MIRIRRGMVAAPGTAERWLAAAAVLTGGFALAIAVSGGFSFELAGVRVRAHGWERPAFLSALALGALAWRRAHDTVRGLEGAWRLACSIRGQRTLTVAACAWAATAAIGWGTFAVGGSDSYGYAAQARLLAHGRLSDIVVVPRGFTWAGAETTLVPLGFRGGRSASEITPTYPPGLPILMAAVMRISDSAIFLVVPLCGVILVWVTWRLGLAMGDGPAGAVAALVLAASPTFLFQVVQPMSDVPAAACWLLGLLLVSKRRVGWVVAGGLVASMAMLIRPNLAPLAALIVLPAIREPRVMLEGREAGRPRETATRTRRLLAYGATFIPGLLFLGFVQAVRYGSPLASGYGSLEYGFSVHNIVPNLARYPRWLTETHTWFVWASAAGPLWIWRHSRDRALAWTSMAIVCAVWASYLPYAYFQPDEWFYTRYLLPALPLMLFFAVAVALWILRSCPAALRAPALIAGTATVLLVLLPIASACGVFRLKNQEAKYPATAAFVRARLPENAFVFAMQHSGSLRYYVGRPIVRWDLVDPERLDEAVRAVRAAGFVPCLVVDLAEDADFHARFAAAGQRALDARDLVGIVSQTRVYVFR